MNACYFFNQYILASIFNELQEHTGLTVRDTNPGQQGGRVGRGLEIVRKRWVGHCRRRGDRCKNTKFGSCMPARALLSNLSGTQVHVLIIIIRVLDNSNIRTLIFWRARYVSSKSIGSSMLQLLGYYVLLIRL